MKRFISKIMFNKKNILIHKKCDNNVQPKVLPDVIYFQQENSADKISVDVNK